MNQIRHNNWFLFRYNPNNVKQRVNKAHTNLTPKDQLKKVNPKQTEHKTPHSDGDDKQ